MDATALAPRPDAPPARGPLRRLLGLVGALALAGGLAACGGGDSGAQETTKPKASASASSDDDGGSTTIEGDGGSVTVDEDDGTVTVEGEDGSATFSGEGTDLPASWPAAVPVVDGTIIFASTSTSNGQETFSASVERDDSVADLYAAVRDALQGAGLEPVTETTAADGAFAMFTGEGWEVVVTVGATDDGATVVYAVAPAS